MSRQRSVPEHKSRWDVNTPPHPTALVRDPGTLQMCDPPCCSSCICSVQRRRNTALIWIGRWRCRSYPRQLPCVESLLKILLPKLAVLLSWLMCFARRFWAFSRLWQKAAFAPPRSRMALLAHAFICFACVKSFCIGTIFWPINDKQLLACQLLTPGIPPARSPGKIDTDHLIPISNENHPHRWSQSSGFLPSPTMLSGGRDEKYLVSCKPGQISMTYSIH